MRLDIGGARLFFDVEGPGLVADGPRMTARPTLLALTDGPGSDHSRFKPHLSALGDVAQVIYLDYRGCGRSDDAPASRLSVDSWADDVRLFLDALEIERPVVLGHSFGGLVAQRFAVRYPDRLSGLALISTFARADIELTAACFARFGGPEIGEIARRFWVAEGGDEAVAAYMSACVPFYAVRPFNVLAEARATDRPDLAARFFGPDGAYRTIDLLPQLGAITCPTLIVHGARDPALPAELARRMHAALRPDLARIEVIKDAAHMIFDDAGPAVIALLRDFLMERQAECAADATGAVHAD